MNFHAAPTEIGSHGRSLEDIGNTIREGTRKGRSLEVAAPGLQTAAAFANFRDTWLGHGEQLSLEIDESGKDTMSSGQDHAANEEWIGRGYNAIRPQ